MLDPQIAHDTQSRTPRFARIVDDEPRHDPHRNDHSSVDSKAARRPEDGLTGVGMTPRVEETDWHGRLGGRDARGPVGDVERGFGRDQRYFGTRHLGTVPGWIRARTKGDRRVELVEHDDAT